MKLFSQNQTFLMKLTISLIFFGISGVSARADYVMFEASDPLVNNIPYKQFELEILTDPKQNKDRKNMIIQGYKKDNNGYVSADVKNNTIYIKSIIVQNNKYYYICFAQKPLAVTIPSDREKIKLEISMIINGNLNQDHIDVQNCKVIAD
jgi:hypothetical protein